MSDSIKKWHEMQEDNSFTMYPGDIKVHDVSKFYKEASEPMIYESPDGGKTVTERPFNGDIKDRVVIKKLVKEDTDHIGDVHKDSQESPVEVFEREYPELSSEFKKIQKDQYELFASKQLDYGLGNIALGGDILNNKEDKKMSLTGLYIRMNDKINRLKNLLSKDKNFVEGEGIQDTFIDISNYGIISLLVGNDKWKK